MKLLTCKSRIAAEKDETDDVSRIEGLFIALVFKFAGLKNSSVLEKTVRLSSFRVFHFRKCLRKANIETGKAITMRNVRIKNKVQNEFQ